jgi:hypothetical protein
VVLAAGSPVGRSLYWGTRLCQCELIRCQSDHDDYACSPGEVAMSGDDGTNLSTRVPVAKCAWVPEVLSCHVCLLMALLLEDPDSGSLNRYW